MTFESVKKLVRTFVPVGQNGGQVRTVSFVQCSEVDEPFTILN